MLAVERSNYKTKRPQKRKIKNETPKLDSFKAMMQITIDEPIQYKNIHLSIVFARETVAEGLGIWVSTQQVEGSNPT